VIAREASSTGRMRSLGTWAAFAAILDIQVVAASLPAIQAALKIRPDQMSWVQTSYLASRRGRPFH
jgi:hypothetical protein